MRTCCLSIRIWFMADVPHLLKNVRNHVLDQGLYCGGRTMVGQQPDLGRELLEDLLETTASDEFKMCHKLTDKHIKVGIGQLNFLEKQ